MFDYGRKTVHIICSQQLLSVIHSSDLRLVILEGGRVLDWSDSVCIKSPYRQLVHLLCGVVRRPWSMIKIVNRLPYYLRASIVCIVQLCQDPLLTIGKEAS